DPRTAPHLVDPHPRSDCALPRPGETVTMTVTLGPREDWFTPAGIETLLSQEWTVTHESDRVGLRLSGEVALERARTGELPSEGAVTGALQVPPNGQPVLFGPDHPLTGGYPIIASVDDVDFAAQLPPGVKLRFTTSPRSASNHQHESRNMSTILIANRGEIAVRIIRACAEHGHTSVAVYADQDADALHVQLADAAFAMPGTTAGQTYLSIDAILAAAQASGADAVHPGYGFLSENPAFAAAVEDAWLIWIGPTAQTITALGDKVTARQLAQKVGAPLAPGIDRPLTDAAEVESFAAEAGLPIIIKAAHGG